MQKENYQLYREEIEKILASCEPSDYNDAQFDKFKEFMDDRWSTDSIKLYRYSLADYFNIRNFETGKLKLTDTGVLNDVYEGIPCNVCGTIDQNIADKLKDIAKIKSFSETPEDVRLWGYYAKDHTGICVEYDLSELDLNDSVWNHIFPVAYSSRRLVKTNVSEMIDELKELRKDIKEESVHDYYGYLEDILPIFIMKSDKWEYEREWRIIYTLLQIYEEDDENLYNGIISFDCATAIYLGCRIDKEIEKNICEIVERINNVRISKNRTAVSVYKMSLAEESYDLVATKINN